MSEQLVEPATGVCAARVFFDKGAQRFEPHQFVGEAGKTGIEAAWVWHDEHGRAGYHLGLFARTAAAWKAKIRLIEADPHEGDQTRSHAGTLSRQGASASGDLVRGEVGGGSSRTRTKVRECDPEFRQAHIVFMRDALEDQARFIEQTPERVARASEMVPDGTRPQRRFIPTSNRRDRRAEYLSGAAPDGLPQIRPRIKGGAWVGRGRGANNETGYQSLWYSAPVKNLVVGRGRFTVAAAVGLLLGFAEPAFAQEPSKKPAEWKVQSKGGLLVTSGNSRTQTATFALDGSRQEGSDKLSFNGGIAYGRSSQLVPIFDMTTGNVTGFGRQSVTATNEWKTRARYDRFFTPNNAAYVLGQLGADQIAGKRLYGGGQVGYSRQAYKTEAHTVVAEIGYDFSYESYVKSPGKTIDPVAIHSGRIFLGDLFSLTKETGINGGLEVLSNLNKEQALDASDSTGATKGVAAFKDTRVVGKLGLTTVLRKSLSFGFGFTVKYDQNPAPRPLPASAGGAMYAPMFLPFADKVDTLTEASLLYTFL